MKLRHIFLPRDKTRQQSSSPAQSAIKKTEPQAKGLPLLPQLAPRLPREGAKRAWDHLEVLQEPASSQASYPLKTYRDETFFRSPAFAFGSFGRVGFASQKSGLRRQVWAVKSIGASPSQRVSGSSSSAMGGAADELHEDVLQEIHAMHLGRSLLMPHRVFVEQDGQTFHLLMPLMHGNLDNVMQAVPPTDFVLRAQLADAIQQPLAEGLAWLHAQSVFLGDIKPENILVDRQGRMVFSDYGLASLSRKRDHLGGTPNYFAPELFRTTHRSYRDLPLFERDIDAAKTDLWSLGVVFLETLLGDNPFAASFWPQDRLPADLRAQIADISDRGLREYEPVHQLMLAWPEASRLGRSRDADPLAALAKDSLLRPLFSQLRPVWPHARDRAQIFNLLQSEPQARSLAGLLGAEYSPVAPSWSAKVELPQPILNLFASFDSVVVQQLAERSFEPKKGVAASPGRHAVMAQHRALAWADADEAAFAQLLDGSGPSFDELSFRSNPFEDVPVLRREG